MKNIGFNKIRKSPMRILFISVILLSVLAVVVNAILYINQQLSLKNDADNDARAIVIVASSGGMCNGPCNNPKYRIYSDGVYEGHDKLTDSQLSQLKKVVDETDFLLYGLKSKPFCPSYVDASDVILSFPKKYPTRSFKLCLIDIPDDDKAFNTIDSVIGIDSRNKSWR